MNGFNSFCREVVELVEKDLSCNKNLDLILDVYNAYQNEERDGVDYIFNLNKADDLVCCINGGLTPKEISMIFERTACYTEYYLFGINHPTPEQFKNIEDLSHNLASWCEDFVSFALKQPYIYKDFFLCYTEKIWE